MSDVKELTDNELRQAWLVWDKSKDDLDGVYLEVASKIKKMIEAEIKARDLPLDRCSNYNICSYQSWCNRYHICLSRRLYERSKANSPW